MTLTNKYTTYRTVGYTYQIAGSGQASTGGVHHHQARKSGDKVLVRIVQSNGRHTDATKGETATAAQLEMIAAAK